MARVSQLDGRGWSNCDAPVVARRDGLDWLDGERQAELAPSVNKILVLLDYRYFLDKTGVSWFICEYFWFFLSFCAFKGVSALVALIWQKRAHSTSSTLIVRSHAACGRDPRTTFGG